MASYQTQTASFLAELYQGIHALNTDTIKIALYSANASMSAATTVYTTANEIIGSGYTAGGQVLTGVVIASAVTTGTTGQTGVSYVNFNDAVWTPAALTARYALIYNASKANRAICVLNFGADKVSLNTFRIQMPVSDPTTALIRSKAG